jgi:hypothetical protein
MLLGYLIKRRSLLSLGQIDPAHGLLADALADRGQDPDKRRRRRPRLEGRLRVRAGDPAETYRRR